MPWMGSSIVVNGGKLHMVTTIKMNAPTPCAGPRPSQATWWWIYQTTFKGPTVHGGLFDSHGRGMSPWSMRCRMNSGARAPACWAPGAAESHRRMLTTSSNWSDWMKKNYLIAQFSAVGRRPRAKKDPSRLRHPARPVRKSSSTPRSSRWLRWGCSMRAPVCGEGAVSGRAAKSFRTRFSLILTLTLPPTRV